MEMEMEVREDATALLERLTAAAGLLEQAAERLSGLEINLEASRASTRPSTREAELERLLAEAEATIAALKGSRKTLPANVATLIAKDGSAVDAAALDAALVSLSLEQRIAVKSQLIRSGLV
jgi:hypothetical protein